MMALLVTPQILLLLFVAPSGVLAVPVTNSNGGGCANSCNNINLKDCCKVANVIKMLGATTTNKVCTITVTDPCTVEDRKFRSTAQPILTVETQCEVDEGWIVIMRRNADISPLIKFTRMWKEYENGFGDLNTEFWYGLKNIHCLTQRDDVELMIELKRNDSTGITWTYQEFRVDGPETNYTLHIGGAKKIEGTSSDHMAYHNGQPFSTIDRDNDAHSIYHCAAREDQGNGGGWWYKNCHDSVLTRPHTGNYRIYWWGGISNTYFPHVEMKIRPKNCLMSGQQADSCNYSN